MKLDQSIIDHQQHSLTLELCHLPCFNQLKVEHIRHIDAGLSNPCFHVSYENKSLFAKYLTANSIEPFVSQLAASEGIAPKLVYVGHNWLVTEFITGQGLEKSDQSEDEKIAIVLALLARCHSILDLSVSYNSQRNHQALAQKTFITDVNVPTQSNIPNLDISATINQLLQKIKLSDTQDKALQFLLNILQKNLVNTSKFLSNIQQVLCHGDTNFSNVIQLKNDDTSAEPLYKLIDFECACIAPIEYELAMLMAVNNIDAGKVELIESLYQQAIISKKLPNKPLDIVDNIASKTQNTLKTSTVLVTCYLDFSFLINALWYMVEYQSRKQLKYKKLAIKQLSILAIRYPQADIVLNEMR
ncbi:aminoglycoside phosphotransferase family protein [Cognaticolwellia beringensis]|uniref:aminoglycoside phosphotransferase family protein n=1 Tax=Cognaticolwellia beringensis TaxID=1967665 RepID=UPI0012F8BC17|nr:aminoglycoside phosphotransferase family protein [Cognaticolwellia beringensis]